MEWIAFVALSAANVVGAFVAPRPPKGWERALLALAFGVCSLAAITLIPVEWPIVRTTLAFAYAGGVLRLIQIVRRPAAHDTRARLLATLFPFIDPRRAQWGKPTLQLGAWVTGAAEVATAIGLFVWAGTFGPRAPYTGGVHGAERTLLGAASIYFLVDGTGRLAPALALAFGMKTDKLHDNPILSRTVGEFWGRRWNRTTAQWLQEHAFRPATARAGVTAGVMAAFGVSALLHVIPIWLASNLQNALVMGSFFILHGGIVLAESKLRLMRLRPGLGRAWTLGVFVATAPLFVEPMLESLGR